MPDPETDRPRQPREPQFLEPIRGVGVRVGDVGRGRAHLTQLSSAQFSLTTRGEGGQREGGASPHSCGPLMRSLGYPRDSQCEVVQGRGGGIATQLRTLDAIAGLPARLSVCGRAGVGVRVGDVGRDRAHLTQLSSAQRNLTTYSSGQLSVSAWQAWPRGGRRGPGAAGMGWARQA